MFVFFFSGGGVGSLLMASDESCAVGTAGSARELFSALTGSCEAMVSCWAEVMTLDSTRNSRFCAHRQLEVAVRSSGSLRS